MLNRSKLLAVVLLVAAFVAGAAVGGAAAAFAARSDRANRERGPRLTYVERLGRELQLSAEQRTAVESIMARHQEPMRQIWTDARGRVDDERTRIRGEIMSVLDQRQRGAFAALNVRHDSLHAERSRGARR